MLGSAGSNLLAIRKENQRSIIESDSRLVTNAINDNICIPKKLVFLLRILDFYHLSLKDIKLE